MKTNKLIKLTHEEHEHIATILRGYVRQITKKLTDGEATPEQRIGLHVELDRARSAVLALRRYDEVVF